MTTLFNIGDKIEFTVTGTVRSFSIDKFGDYYTIILDNSDNETRISLDTKTLLAANAKKIINEET